jgi:hypothetical protein
MEDISEAELRHQVLDFLKDLNELMQKTEQGAHFIREKQRWLIPAYCMPHVGINIAHIPRNPSTARRNRFSQLRHCPRL